MATHLNKTLRGALSDYINRYGVHSLYVIIADIISGNKQTKEDVINERLIKDFIQQNYE